MIGVVFPNVIHHYQVFSSEVNEAVFINAPQMILVRLKMYCNNAPQYPVVKSDVIPDENVQSSGIHNRYRAE